MQSLPCPQRTHATRFPALQCVLALILAITLGSTHAASEIDVPYIGEPADRSLSPLEEQRLGREVMRQLLTHQYVLEDPQIEDYIAGLGQQLLQHTNDQHIGFKFFAVRDAAINAFAMPGGYIGINAGLLMASDSESELAGVMAHEIAHVTQRHIARSMDDTRGWDVASTALLLAALIAGAHDPELAQAALGIGMSAAMQKQINFTRANELEADRLGIKTLSAAGFDPQGMASFFHRLSQKSQLYGEGVPEILRTHPVNTTRISEAQARAASLPSDGHDSSLNYALMKARARVLMTELSSDAVRYFQATHKADPSPENRYGLALALRRARAFEESEALLQALHRDNPEEVTYKIALGELYLYRGDYDTAIRQLRQTRKAHQKNRTVLLLLADAMIRNAQPQQARQLMLETDLLNRGDSEAFRLLALAARDMDEPAEAHFQMSAYSHSRGDYVGAIRQLRNGLRVKDLNAHDRKRLQGRLNEYIGQIPESERRRAESEERQRRQGY